MRRDIRDFLGKLLSIAAPVGPIIEPEPNEWMS